MMPIRCQAGLHNDGTDDFGGYSPTCLRCGGPSWNGPTATFRGVVMSVIGVILVFLALVMTPALTSEIVALVCGGVLFLLGLVMIWRRKP